MQGAKHAANVSVRIGTAGGFIGPHMPYPHRFVDMCGIGISPIFDFMYKDIKENGWTDCGPELA